MKAKDKLRVIWSREENSVMFHYPLGFQTKCDSMFLSEYITDELANALEKRGYDKTTLKFEIQPKKGDQNFASQREIPLEEEFLKLSKQNLYEIIDKNFVKSLKNKS